MHKKLVFSGVALLAVIAITTTVVVFKSSINARTVLQDDTAISAPLEGKTSVSKESLAAKVDFARKIVAITDASQADALKKKVTELGGTVIEQTDPTTFVIQLAKDTVAEQEAQLVKESLVANIDTDYPIAVSADRIDWGVERVFAPKVWEKTTGNAVKVAILDTGIDANHTDLNNTITASYNFIENTTNVTDGHGHGTHVAGVVTSVKNDTGYLGASYQSKLLVGKVLGDDGAGYLSDVIDGIHWARQNGAQVINLSLGTEYNSKILEDAINRAVNAGVTVVAAAGNTSGGKMLYPAAYSSVISVGASDTADNLASFSAIGATLVAPGVGITSTLPGNTYGRWSGTSMAAPHVSAAVALLIAKGETKVKETLFATASSVNAGLLPNLEKAVSNQDTHAPLITILEPGNDAIVSGNITLKASVTDEFGIKEVIFALGSKELTRFTVEPYTHTLDTSLFTNGSYDFLVTGSDQNGNTGTVKVTITINNNGTTSPTPSASLSPSATPSSIVTTSPTETVTATPSPGSTSTTAPRQDSNNVSQEVRQDTNSDNASVDVRQDSKTETPTLPVGTNYGQRESVSQSVEVEVNVNKSEKSNSKKQR